MAANPTDPFYNYPQQMGTPARNAASVTPSDTDDLPVYAKALYIGTAGDLQVTLTNMAVGTSVVLADHPAGYAPLQVKRVWDASTTADDIVALYDFGTITP